MIKKIECWPVFKQDPKNVKLYKEVTASNYVFGTVH